MTSWTRVTCSSVLVTRSYPFCWKQSTILIFLRLKPIFIAPIQATIEATSESPLLSSSFCRIEINFRIFLNCFTIWTGFWQKPVPLNLCSPNCPSCGKTAYHEVNRGCERRTMRHFKNTVDGGYARKTEGMNERITTWKSTSLETSKRRKVTRAYCIWSFI